MIPSTSRMCISYCEALCHRIVHRLCKRPDFIQFKNKTAAASLHSFISPSVRHLANLSSNKWTIRCSSPQSREINRKVGDTSAHLALLHWIIPEKGMKSENEFDVGSRWKNERICHECHINMTLSRIFVCIFSKKIFQRNWIDYFSPFSIFLCLVSLPLSFLPWVPKLLLSNSSAHFLRSRQHPTRRMMTARGDGKMKNSDWKIRIEFGSINLLFSDGAARRQRAGERDCVLADI